MIIVDTNVVLDVTNRQAPHHERTYVWWQTALSGKEAIGLPWVVVMGFLRLSTNSAVFPQPYTMTEACSRVQRWFAEPIIRQVDTIGEHWQHLHRLLEETDADGKLVTDAHIAALAISRGAAVASLDNDFARFPGLRWINPLLET